MQRQAGYILEGLPKLFSGSQREQIESLARQLSFFSVETNDDLTPKKALAPHTVIIYNIITRGLPTLAPTFIEDIISATFVKTKKEYLEKGNFVYDFVNDELKEEIYRAFHIIDPRLSLRDMMNLYDFAEDPERQLKRQFLFDIVAPRLGEHLLQIISIGRSFDSIFRYSPRNYERARRLNLIGTNVDFSIELPYKEEGQPRGIAIELEKKLLDDRSILSIDERNEVLNAIDWANLLYIKQAELGNPEVLTPLEEFTYANYFEILLKNYQRPLYNTSAGLDGLQIALTPFEVARIQRTLIDYILAGHLDLSAAKWEIAVVERDIPGAFLAIQDLKQQFLHLYNLAGIKQNFPQIELHLYYTPEFESAELNVLYQGQKFLLEEFDAEREYDLVIDSSILRYEGLDRETLATKAKHYVRLRSSRYADSERVFYSSEQALRFKPIVVEAQDEVSKQEAESRQESLMYFVKNIFRYYELNPVQYQVLSSVLSGHNTVIDAPFTYQKTLLMQIATLLQSGFSLVVSPLYTVEQDLERKFKYYRIDVGSFTGASVYDIHEYWYRHKRLTAGEFLILLAPAEAFHLKRFRKVLTQLSTNDKRFSLVVVDQINGVSPWSHLFNFSYYTLGQNIKRHLPGGDDAVILGLTATASYDVMSDISKFFQIDENRIYRANHDYANIEFAFHLLGQEQSVEERRLDTGAIEGSKVEYLVKHEDLLRSDTIVYSHKSRKFYQELSNKLYKLNLGLFDTRPHLRVFYSSRRLSSQSYQNFQRFLEHEIEVLVANRAVAIGLDKPDVRRLIISSLPLGVEEFIQLVSRAGRDLEPAQILFVLSMLRVTYDRTGYILSGAKINSTRETRRSFYEEYQNFKLLDILTGNMLKDFMLMDEILNQASVSSETLEEVLIRRIKQDFDLWVYFELQPVVEPTMLYVYDQDELLGYLDLENERIVNQASATKRDLAEQILMYLDFEIRNIVAKPRDIFLILRDPLNIGERVSLVRKLVNLKDGEEGSIIVDFTNNVPKQIVELFPEHDLTPNLVIQIYEQTYSFKEFSDALRQFIDRRTLRKKQEQLRDLYFRFRNFFDTYRLIYYLLTIGVVDDYLIDLTNQCFILILKKQPDDQYLNRIYRRILPFVTKERALEVFEKTPRIDGETILQKAANYWIYFDHSIIQAKRYQSVTDLVRILSWSLEQQEPEQSLRKYLSTYFYAKYILDLEQKMAESQDDWMKVIDYFIQKISYFKDNWQHLLHSAEYIIDQQPSNFVARMLRGWATLILSQDNQQISKALDDIALGMNTWRIQTGTSIERFLEKVNEFYDVLENVSYDLKAKAENLFPIKLINTWLEDFNKKFIDIT